MDIKKLCTEAAKQLQNPSGVRLEVRGGNSGVVTPQGEVFADSPGQCLRNITLRAYGISEPISLKTQITFHLGYAWEQLFEKLLKASDGVTDVQTQLNVREEGSIPWSGTADFVATVNGRKTLFDTKSISSLNSYVSVFFDGKVKVSYVAQMVRYMTALNISQGYLVYASFLYVGKGNVTAGQYRKMGEVSANPDIKAVQISIVGDEISVDGFPWDYTLTDVLEHTKRAQNNLHNEIVEPYRPCATGDFSPCYSCHFNKACATFEASGSKDLRVFLKLAKEI
jgi:hypothetical protein